MNDDDVRRALSAYADATPDLDPRVGLAARFARRERQRRATVAGTACLAALVAGTGVATLTRDNGSAAVVASGDGPSSSPSESPAETASPTPASTPSHHPSPTATGVSPSASPAEPGSNEPIVRTAGGPDGLRLRVTLTRGRPAAGEQAVLEVEADDDDGQPYLAGLSWGDGSSSPRYSIETTCVRVSSKPLLPGAPTPSPSSSPTERPPSPGHIAESFEHAWRNAGDYVVSVDVRSKPGCADDPPAEETERVTFVVHVAPGDETSNGPFAPGAAADDPEATDEANGISLTAFLVDEDGYVGTATIDWGDGSKPTTLRNGADCDDGDGRRYPQGGGFQATAEHVYAKAGDYEARVTFTSTGCDGRDPQRGSLGIPVSV